MTFDWSINVGHLITLIGIGFGILSAYYVIKSDVRTLDNKIESAYKALDVRLLVVETIDSKQVDMNAKILAEIGAVRQDVAVLRDRVEPPTISPQSPSKGSVT